MRDYSQAAQTWARAEPEEGPADEETGSLGTHSAHSGGKAGRDQDQTMNTTASDLTSVREGEVSVLSGDTSPYQHGGGHRQSRQDDYDGAAEEEHDDDDDVLDPAELEMLNEEAERMKGIGNRHMANQEFNRAYNAYSAALKLSPVGPSSHVFLSNRAAALLSLRQYSQAATDARRAIALAPTFSKAHARLGQALYFMRDYSGAVTAYEDAVRYEPDNDITKNYLKKAKEKEAKQMAKQLASRGGLGAQYGGASDMSLSGSVGDSIMAANMSVVSDPNRTAAVVSSNAGMRGITSDRIGAVVSKELKRSAVAVSGAPLAGVDENNATIDEEDPDFDEALRLHEMATASLASKNYKDAVEAYSAALFLVPDDGILSPQLHIGRCHALNGLKRHTSAANDARLAIRIDPNNSEAHSALAKSLFYEGEYEEAIEAFERSASLLAPHESVSMFDQAYLEKARECLDEEEKIEDETGEESPRKTERKRINYFKSVVPKLRAPRFVSRRQVVESSPIVPSMPKTWPKQSSVQVADSLKVGPERLVAFYSESMGIRLNRGASDGIVRIVAVKDIDADPGSPIAREGRVELGDVLREVAGVDLRRPITAVMWSDTVALIKISPRPLDLILAKELSAPPSTFLDELAKATMPEAPAEAEEPPTEVELPSFNPPTDNIEEEQLEGDEHHDVEEINDSDDDHVDLELSYSEDGRAMGVV